MPLPAITFSKSWPFSLRASCARRQACGLGPPSSMWHTYSVRSSLSRALPPRSGCGCSLDPSRPRPPATAARLRRWQLYAAFLRGMNVGRPPHHQRRAARICAGPSGLQDAALLSGQRQRRLRVRRARDAGGVDGRDRGRASRSALGYDVPDLRAHARRRCSRSRRTGPFSAEVAAGAPRQAAGRAPRRAAPAAARAGGSRSWPASSDDVAFGPREMHWLPRGGMLDSTLDMAALESVLGPMTMRTARHRLRHSPPSTSPR